MLSIHSNRTLQVVPLEHQEEFEHHLITYYFDLMNNDYFQIFNKHFPTVTNFFDQVINNQHLQERFYPQWTLVRRFDLEADVNRIFCDDIKTLLNKHCLFYAEEPDFRLGEWDRWTRNYKNIPITQVW